MGGGGGVGGGVGVGGVGPVTSPPYMISSRGIYLRTGATFEGETWYTVHTALMT